MKETIDQHNGLSYQGRMIIYYGNRTFSDCGGNYYDVGTMGVVREGEEIIYVFANPDDGMAALSYCGWPQNYKAFYGVVAKAKHENTLNI